MKKPPMNSKKKIAVFANGWNSENLSYCMDGLREGLEDSSVDLYVFLGHDAYSSDEVMVRCEASIYELPRMTMFCTLTGMYMRN